MADSAPAPNPPLHEALVALQPLIGTWRGSGEGHYPTIDAFEYLEELVIGHVGKPFLSIGHKTRRNGGAGEPLHAEAGYVRPTPSGTFELIIVHPSGITELHHDGTIATDDDGTLVVTLRSTQVLCTPTAKSVEQVERVYRCVGDALSYDISMAAVGQPLTHHLHADLSRVEP